MSDLIVSKPFLRGSKRFRRNEPAPTDLDKPTLNEYLRLGLLAPAENKPAGLVRRQDRAEPKRRETPGPRTTKPAGPADGGAAAAAASNSATVADAPANGDLAAAGRAVVDAAADASAASPANGDPAAAGDGAGSV